MLPASLVAAAGMSLAFIPSLGTAISSAKPEEGGLASGIVNTSYQVGSALGLAAMTARRHRAGRRPARRRRARSPTATRPRSSAPPAIAVAGALLAAILLRVPKAPAAVSSDETTNEDRQPVAA